MADMAAFFASILTSVAQFLGSDPIVYLYGLVLLLVVVLIFKRLVQ